MARQRGARKVATGRGSPEAVEKRRTARQLNTLLMGGADRGDKLDGRTEKRRQRLIKELKDGRGGRPLKPIDFVSHVNELIDIGESVGSLKKQGVKPRKIEATPDVVDVAKRTQAAYGFHPDAWRFLGLDVAAAAGEGGKRRGAGKKRKAAG